MNQKYIFAGLFLLFIILSGVWLSRTGRPLSVLILTLHKLLSVGCMVFLAITIYRIHQTSPLSSIEIILSLVTFMLFIVLIATGGLLSTTKEMPLMVLKIHQIIPIFVILCTVADLFFVVQRNR